MRTKNLIFVLALGVIFVSSKALGGDSEAAKLQREKRRYASADAELNKTFQALRKQLAEEEFKELRDLQREWLQHRDYISDDQPRQEGYRGDDPKKSAVYWESMADLTEARTKFLQASFDRSLPKGISGIYEDSAGGELKLEKRTDGIVFQINVVRGPTTHTGGLAGLALLKDGTAVYQEQVEPGEDREPCELTFTFSRGRVVKVEGKNTEYYHGARAYFHGTYFKVAKLDEPIDLNSKED